MPDEDKTREQNQTNAADKNRKAGGQSGGSAAAKTHDPHARSGRSAQGAQTGAGQVSTSDAIVNSRDERLAKRPPESTVSFETSPRGTISNDLADPASSLKSPTETHDRNGKHRHDREGRPKKRKKHHEPPPVAALNWKSLAAIGVLELVCGVVGAWGYSALFGSAKSDEQEKSQKKDDDKSSGKKQKGEKGSGSETGETSEGGEGSASASQIPGFTSADDAETLQKQLKHLDDRIDRLGQRIDRVTRPEDETPPVLHTLQVQMNDLAREIDELAGLPAHLHRIDRQIASLEEQLKTLRSQQATTDESSGVGLGAAAGAPSSPSVAGGNDPTFGLAIGLFQEAQYSQARQVLRRLQREHPKDARVWYFSALANALASGDWKGETEVLVEKGVECERSGKPSKAEIDLSMSVLTPSTGGEWLARHRRDAHPRQAFKNEKK